METPRPTPPQSQIHVIHSCYESPPRSPSGRSASVVAPTSDSSAPARPSQEPPVVANPVSLHPYTVQGMYRFECRVSEEMQRRFQDVLTRLAGPLATYLRKSRHEHRPTAIRLMFLGHYENSARPWVVVLCPELVKKRAEKFFKKDMAQRICQSDEPGRESFQVAVVGHAPRPTAGEFGVFVEVASDLPTHPGSSGWSLQVKMEHRGISSLATMGGYIVVEDHHGTETVYGLTAGHVMPQTGYDSPSSDERWDGSIPSPASSDLEDDGTPVPENSPPSHNRNMSENSTEHQSAVAWTYKKIAKESFSRRARDRDWALIQGVDANQLHSLEYEAKEMPISLGSMGEPRPLQIGFNGEFGPDCTLSGTACMVLTPSGHNFVSAQILIPDSSKRLRGGISGAWVTRRPEYVKRDPTRDDVVAVYGQVIADDVFGDVYMIPLRDILGDIQTLMAAALVRLPSSTRELEDILSKQLRREQADQQAVTDSKDMLDLTTDSGAGRVEDSSTRTSVYNHSRRPEPNILPHSAISENFGAFIVQNDKRWRASPAAAGYLDEYENDAKVEEYHSEWDLPHRRYKALLAKEKWTQAPWTSKEDQHLEKSRDKDFAWDRSAKEFPGRSEGILKKPWYQGLQSRDLGKEASPPPGMAEQE